MTHKYRLQATWRSFVVIETDEPIKEYDFSTWPEGELEAMQATAELVDWDARKLSDGG